MQADPESHSTEGSSTTTSTMEAPSSAGDAPFRDEERGLLTPTTTRPFAGAAEDATEIQVQQHPTSDAASDGFLKRKTSQLLEAVSFTSSHGPGDAPLSLRLATLVDAYAASAVAAAIAATMRSAAGCEKTQGPKAQTSDTPAIAEGGNNRCNGGEWR